MHSGRSSWPSDWILQGMMVLALLTGTIGFTATGQWFWLAIAPVLLVLWAGLRSQRFLFFLMVGSVPLSLEFQLTDTLGTDLPDEVLMWMFTGVMGLFACSAARQMSRLKADRILLALMLAQIFWVSITVIQSPDPLISLKYLAAKIWFMVAFVLGAWWIVRREQDLSILLWLLGLTMGLGLCIVLWNQFVLDFSFDAVNAAVKPFFRNHVNYSAILVCLLPLPILACIFLPAWRLPFLMLTVFWILALALSYSRGAWIAPLAALVVVWLMRRKILIPALLISFMLALSLGVYFMQGNRFLDYAPNYSKTIYHQRLDDHLEATYRLRDLSTVERFYRWIAGAAMVEDKPVFGHGPNRFYDAYQSYTVSAFRTYVSDNPEHSTVHNYFLLLAAEQGIPGLLIFMLILLRMFWLLQFRYRHAASKKERALWATVAAVLAMIVWLNILSDLIETDKIGSLFYICAGLILGSDRWGNTFTITNA